MELNARSSNGNEYVVPIETLNLNLVRKEVTKDDHPHPLFLLAIGIIVILVLYLMYLSFVKSNLSGSWYNTDLNTKSGRSGNRIKISHNVWNDTFTINDNLVGTVVGNALYIKSPALTMGIVNKKKIYWLNTGEIWHRPTRAL